MFKIPKTGAGGVASKQDTKDGNHKEFTQAVQLLVKKAADNDVSITLGNHGWISKEEAQKKADNGNEGYNKNLKYFGWGLAKELRKTSDKSKVEKLASDLNLKLHTSTGGFMFIAPKKVEIDETLQEVKYEGDTTQTTGSGGGGANLYTTAYFFANQFQSIQDVTASELLQGERALANDEPLWTTIKQMVNASLRSCASGPNGEFFAWYPDYWGAYGNKTPALILEDIELKDLNIEVSDDELYTHVFVPGVDIAGNKVALWDTQGVVSIESDLAAKVSEATANSEDSEYEVSDEVSQILKKLIYIPEGEEWKYSPKEIYRRYGARPNTTSSMSSGASLIEDISENSDSKPQYILPFLYALYEFMKHWSNLYKVSLDLTFQPSLFPGCRIKVKSLDISFYVESVTHNMNYNSGFTTNATCTCPIGTLLPGMVNPDFKEE